MATTFTIEWQELVKSLATLDRMIREKLIKGYNYRLQDSCVIVTVLFV